MRNNNDNQQKERKKRKTMEGKDEEDNERSPLIAFALPALACLPCPATLTARDGQRLGRLVQAFQELLVWQGLYAARSVGRCTIQGDNTCSWGAEWPSWGTGWSSWGAVWSWGASLP